MFSLLFILLIYTVFAGHIATAAEKIPGGWTESGELAYSYAYARSYIGHQMRKEGWSCKMGFTAGKFREQEHSVWLKGSRKMQVMIWKINSNRTGYSKGEIKASQSKKK